MWWPSYLPQTHVPLHALPMSLQMPRGIHADLLDGFPEGVMQKQQFSLLGCRIQLTFTCIDIRCRQNQNKTWPFWTCKIWSQNSQRAASMLWKNKTGKIACVCQDSLFRNVVGYIMRFRNLKVVGPTSPARSCTRDLLLDEQITVVLCKHAHTCQSIHAVPHNHAKCALAHFVTNMPVSQRAPCFSYGFSSHCSTSQTTLWADPAV